MKSLIATQMRGIVLLLVLSIFLPGCAWLDVQQRQAIYRPSLAAAPNLEGLRPQDLRYFLDIPQAQLANGSAQRIEMWWLPHPDPNAPTLLYCHGTFRNLDQNLPKINALREAGFAILAVEYRGWGLSSPITPSEQTIMQDAQLALEELLKREPRPLQRVLYGHSMGSGVAVDLASRLTDPLQIGGVILESAFTSFKDVAIQVGWLGRLLAKFNRERFASIDKIKNVKAPLLMLHGQLDTTVQARLGNTLYKAANEPKRWVLLDNGKHSDLQEVHALEYQAALRQFMQQHFASKN
ncbi:MAG: alpha/beta hydrolase [Burkholderiales bacterium]|nr:MAG: alpha/beta hydrolase [Burkholderiales bacterium]